MDTFLFLSPLACPGSGALTHASLYLVGAPLWQTELAQERMSWPPGACLQGLSQSLRGPGAWEHSGLQMRLS